MPEQSPHGTIRAGQDGAQNVHLLEVHVAALDLDADLRPSLQGSCLRRGNVKRGQEHAGIGRMAFNQARDDLRGRFPRQPRESLEFVDGAPWKHNRYPGRLHGSSIGIPEQLAWPGCLAVPAPAQPH